MNTHWILTQQQAFKLAEMVNRVAPVWEHYKKEEFINELMDYVPPIWKRSLRKLFVTDNYFTREEAEQFLRDDWDAKWELAGRLCLPGRIIGDLLTDKSGVRIDETRAHNIGLVLAKPFTDVLPCL